MTCIIVGLFHRDEWIGLLKTSLSNYGISFPPSGIGQAKLAMPSPP